MYLHVGNNRILRKNSVIGIFDMDTATVSPHTRKFLTTLQRQMCLDLVGREIPKAFVLYDDNGQSRACLSPISVSALHGRIND